MEKRKCLHCKEALEGRADKIFCSPYCKSAHHYQRKIEQTETTFKRIQRQLRLNHQLLKHFNAAGKATIRESILLKAGFDPAFLTHYYRTKNDNVYIFCYDMGYMRKKEGNVSKYVLIHWQDYMIPNSPR